MKLQPDTESELIIDPGKKKILDWKELWQYRELFYFFAWRDIKVKYKHTLIGVFWVVLQPVFTVVIFSVLFLRALNLPELSIPYPLFILSGLISWTLFSSSVNNAGTSMLSHAPIIKKIYFPRIIIPIAAILVSLIDYIIAFFIFLLLLLYYRQEVNFLYAAILWPVSIITLFLGTVGVSCLLSALTVKYRDFRYVIPFALQILLFVSPVIYPVSIVDDKFLRYILALNPIYGPIMIFRLPLGVVTDVNLILISFLSMTVLLSLGIFYFKRTEDYFADIA